RFPLEPAQHDKKEGSTYAAINGRSSTVGHSMTALFTAGHSSAVTTIRQQQNRSPPPRRDLWMPWAFSRYFGSCQDVRKRTVRQGPFVKMRENEQQCRPVLSRCAEMNSGVKWRCQDVLIRN